MWCIGKITSQYRERMYALIELYLRPYDPDEPVICVDEKSKQLLQDIRKPIAGKIRKYDYEYQRNGVRNIFIAVEPKAGKRVAQVTEHRKKSDYAEFIRYIIGLYPSAKVIHLVADNLNIHFKSSFYETFSKKEAEYILSRIEFHYTPKHASWLNMAEIEISIMQRQCLNRRIPDHNTLKRELLAWQLKRNQNKAKIQWKFTQQDSDRTLHRHYS